MLIGCTLVQMYSVLERYTEELVPAWQSDCYVWIRSLSSLRNTIREGQRNCDRTWSVSFYNEYNPPFLLLINTVHGLTPLVIVDFPFECYTWPSEVRFGAGHSLWVYFPNIRDSTLLLLGLLMYIDSWGKSDCCCIAGCTWSMLLYSPSAPCCRV